MAAADGANGAGESQVSSPTQGGSANGTGRKKAAKGAKRIKGNGKSKDPITPGEVNDENGEISEPVKLEYYMGSNAVIKVDHDNGNGHNDDEDDDQGNGDVLKEKEKKPWKKRKRDDRKQRTSETEVEEGSTLVSISSDLPC